MGFLSKLFKKRKNGRSSAKSGKKHGATAAAVSSKITDRDSPTMNEDPIALFSQQNTNEMPSSGPSAPLRATSSRRGPDISDGGERPIVPSVQHKNTSPSYKQTQQHKHSGPIDLDHSDWETSPEKVEEHTDTVLSTQKLQEFTQMAAHAPAPPRFGMAPEPVPRFSAGHVAVAIHNDDNSDGESSSFNLSTDAEDTEYEDLRKRGVLRMDGQGMASGALPTSIASPMDTSNMSQISVPTAYGTDGETSVFPNLHTDDEGTERGDDSDALSGVNGNTRNAAAAAAEKMKILSLEKTPSSDAWQDVPSVNNTDAFGFQGSSNSNHQAFNATSNNFGRRDFTSPKDSLVTSNAKTTSPKNSGQDPFADDGFGNFADFSAFSNDPWPETKPATASDPTSRGNAAPQEPAAHSAPRRSVSTSHQPALLQQHRAQSSASSAVTSDESLSELLAKANSKRTSQKSKKSGGSVNSAPAISAAYLRKHHGLKSGGHQKHNDGTSVTDIIKSLEADNASRASSKRSSHRRSHSDAHSIHSRDNHSVRSTKEKFRRRRRRSAAQNEPHSSDSDDDNESWLMDEVTGALGPRGIAADLESLSGRSNRSRSSGGGRSRRNNRTRSSRRAKNSSSESVDSHGSRRSRSSRYSHRSTKSYISTMSEQSRSVANDLLRLEMQLAMVNPNGSTPTSESVRSTRSGRSARSSSRRSSSGGTPRRTRITVVAPPGKLGIILANKADSRGTVVSGVRTSSVLADQISPGDRIVAIDGEDVSIMTVSEITTIMARKSEFERTLSVLTTTTSTPTSNGGGSPDFRYRN